MYGVLKLFAQPYACLMILLGAGLIVLWFRRDLSWRLFLVIWLAWGATVLLSVPLASDYLVGTLEKSFPVMSTLPSEMDVIIALGGGLKTTHGCLVSSTLTASSLRRCVTTAEIYHQSNHASVIVCGGATKWRDDTMTEAQAMSDCLEMMDVPRADIIREEQSLNTRENVLAAAQIIQEHGFRRVALVTSASHMKRATMCFGHEGISVIPCLCGQRATATEWGSVAQWVPSANALARSNSTIQEWIGIAWYKLQGWV